MPLNITNVWIDLIKPKSGIIGFACLTIDRSLHMSGIAIHERLDGNGYRLTYPNRKRGNHLADIFHPLNAETSKQIEAAIFSRLKDVLAKTENCNAGYNDTKPASRQL
jgi:DNA-binding cell septation regulator SpoVG